MKTYHVDVFDVAVASNVFLSVGVLHYVFTDLLISVQHHTLKDFLCHEETPYVTSRLSLLCFVGNPLSNVQLIFWGAPSASDRNLGWPGYSMRRLVTLPICSDFYNIPAKEKLIF